MVPSAPPDNKTKIIQMPEYQSKRRVRKEQPQTSHEEGYNIVDGW